MSDAPANANAVPKVHPATRELLPEDPLDLHGFEVPGDQDLMIRMLVEEYARMGWNVDAIMSLACDPNYRVFHALLARLGEDELRRRITGVISRCGVIRVRETEKEPPPAQLVQIELPEANSNVDDLNVRRQPATA